MKESRINLSNKITEKVLEVIREEVGSQAWVDEAYIWQFLPFEIDKILDEEEVRQTEIEK